MPNNQKIAIYKGILWYLLESKNFSLQKVANLSNVLIAHLQLIHRYNQLPKSLDVEINLLKLFIMVLRIERKKERDEQLDFDYQMDWEI